MVKDVSSNCSRKRQQQINERKRWSITLFKVLRLVLAESFLPYRQALIRLALTVD